MTTIDKFWKIPPVDKTWVDWVEQCVSQQHMSQSLLVQLERLEVQILQEMQARGMHDITVDEEEAYHLVCKYQLQMYVRGFRL
jgi:hypothetical protein